MLRLCWKLHDHMDTFVSLAKISFDSMLYARNFAVGIDFPLGFFDEIMDHASIDEERIDEIVTFYFEVACHTILFNDVRRERVAKVCYLFEDIAKFIENSGYSQTRAIDAKDCDCDEYRASGDCYCNDFKDEVEKM